MLKFIFQYLKQQRRAADFHTDWARAVKTLAHLIGLQDSAEALDDALAHHRLTTPTTTASN